MYPYSNHVQWWIRGSYKQLVDAIAQIDGAERGQAGKNLQAVAKRIKKWILIRIFMVIPLSASVIAILASYLIELFSEADVAAEAATGALDVFVTVSTTFAGAFALGYLLATRVLDQLRGNAIVLLAVQASHGRLSK